MKRVLAITLAIIMCLSLCACSTEMNDAGFVTNLTKGLEARWKISDSSTTFTSLDAYMEHLYKCVDAELSMLGAYSDYTFVDENLAALAEQYFVALESQREGIQYYESDYNKYEELFTTKGYNKRAELIYLISKEYNLQVSKNNFSTLSDFIVLGEKVNAIEDILSQDLLLEFTGMYYELVIENTTKYDLSGAQLNFTLNDDAGVGIYTVSTYVDTWTAGSKINASVYPNEHDFASVEMSIYINSGRIGTNPVPIEHVNNLIIDIVAPDLPMELSCGLLGKVFSTVIINSFDYEVDYWPDGTASANLFFSGTKTFDKDGENGSNPSGFSYKLYDVDNVVVRSGIVYVYDLAVGESFKNADGYTGDLEPGTYRLVLADDLNQL